MALTLIRTQTLVVVASCLHTVSTDSMYHRWGLIEGPIKGDETYCWLDVGNSTPETLSMLLKVVVSVKMGYNGQKRQRIVEYDVLIGNNDIMRLQQLCDILKEDRCRLLSLDIIALSVSKSEKVLEGHSSRSLACHFVSALSDYGMTESTHHILESPLGQ